MCSTCLTGPVSPLLAVSAPWGPLRLLHSLLSPPYGLLLVVGVLAGAAGAGRAQHPRDGDVHRAQVRLVRHVVAVVSVAWSGLRLSQILRTSIKIPYR